MFPTTTITITTLLLSLLATQTSAHFYLTHPQGLGTNANNEEISPCGGFMPTFTDTTDYYVGGDAINVVTSHPQVNMLFRATLDTTAQGNWSVLYPVIATYGLGSFCIPTVPAPKEFAGKNGVVQVIQNGEDGLLFQCAAVTFQAERSAHMTTLCSNATGVTASFSSDAELPADGSSTGTSGSTTSASNTAAAATATTSKPSSAAILGGLSAVLYSVLLGGLCVGLLGF